MVSSCSSNRSSDQSATQRITVRFDRCFVPAVLAFAVLLLLASAMIDEPFSTAFYRAMAVLVAASSLAITFWIAR
jgi:Cd2+/Zn2+-exporting ATPase